MRFDLTTFIIAALATHRLAQLISEDEGPGWPFGTPEQRKAGVFTRMRGRLDPDQQTWIGRGVNCIKCVGFWVALPVALFVTVLGHADAWAWPLTWLGIAGAVVLIRRWEQKR